MVTLNSDGSPQVSCIWVGMDGDEIVSGHLPRNQKVKNVERDGRVAISIEGEGLSEMGLRQYLVVRGTARVTEGGAAELLQRLAHVYLGPDVVFPAMPDPPPGFVAAIAIERIGGLGRWAAPSG